MRGCVGAWVRLLVRKDRDDRPSLSPRHRQCDDCRRHGNDIDHRHKYSITQGWTARIRSARSLFVICIAYYVTDIQINLSNFVSVLPSCYLVGSRWILFSSSLVNGLLYILVYKSTRRDFRRMFFGCAGGSVAGRRRRRPKSLVETADWKRRIRSRRRPE